MLTNLNSSVGIGSIGIEKRQWTYQNCVNEHLSSKHSSRQEWYGSCPQRAFTLFGETKQTQGY